ncbi:hypothetical protein N656DRAFT_165978 [Canariomyces notabilis]|uniref:Uncharacterized protein n=1 Tax=Canariomyces notabilis TaxID=2074819 RepID=A0AAN6QKF5_9PEZI|nr:hypothetical protein N656DRAFT_165978 [Canariomyces arenarius]
MILQSRPRQDIFSFSFMFFFPSLFYMYHAQQSPSTTNITCADGITDGIAAELRRDWMILCRSETAGTSARPNATPYPFHACSMGFLRGFRTFPNTGGRKKDTPAAYGVSTARCHLPLDEFRCYGVITGDLAGIRSDLSAVHT